MKTTSALRRALAVGAGIALTAVTLTTQNASAALNTNAGSALDFLKKELAANGHHMNFAPFGDFPPSADIGLTIDAILALQAGGRGADAETKSSTDYVIANAPGYLGFQPNSQSAGATGKLLLLTQARGLADTVVTGHDLETDLRSQLDPSGRFKDKGFTEPDDFEDPESPTHPVDYSNGVGQAFAMMSLGNTDAGVPASAVTYMLKQQCPNGSFRVVLGDAQCTANASGDVDGTAFAVLGLLNSPESSARNQGVLAGVGFLANSQASDGSLASGNANSTGLAGSVLRAVGDAPDANQASDFIKTLQLTTGDDKGAIGKDKASADTAKASGITAANRATFDRSTAQAVLAMGLPSYIEINDVTPVEPAPSASVSSPSVPLGGNVTVSGTGFLAGETVQVTVKSDPIIVGGPKADGDSNVSFTFAAPAAAGAGAHTIELKGLTSGVIVTAPITLTAAVTTTTTVAGATTTTRAIVRTGTQSENQSLFAGVLLVAGLALVLVARQRRVIYPFKK